MAEEKVNRESVAEKEVNRLSVAEKVAIRYIPGVQTKMDAFFREWRNARSRTILGTNEIVAAWTNDEISLLIDKSKVDEIHERFTKEE